MLAWLVRRTVHQHTRGRSTSGASTGSGPRRLKWAANREQCVLGREACWLASWVWHGRSVAWQAKEEAVAAVCSIEANQRRGFRKVLRISPAEVE